MNWILARLKERSTWAALITLAGIAGYKVNPELQEAIVTAGTAVIAVIFAITADQKPEVKSEAGRVAQQDTAQPQTIVTPESGRASDVDGQ